MFSAFELSAFERYALVRPAFKLSAFELYALERFAFERSAFERWDSNSMSLTLAYSFRISCSMKSSSMVSKFPCPGNHDHASFSFVLGFQTYFLTLAYSFITSCSMKSSSIILTS